MFKTQASLEVKGHEKRVYQLLCNIDSPPGEILDVLCQMKAHVISYMQIIEKQQNDKLKSESEAVKSE